MYTNIYIKRNNPNIKLALAWSIPDLATEVIFNLRRYCAACLCMDSITVRIGSSPVQVARSDVNQIYSLIDERGLKVSFSSTERRRVSKCKICRLCYRFCILLVELALELHPLLCIPLRATAGRLALTILWTIEWSNLKFYVFLGSFTLISIPILSKQFSVFLCCRYFH